MEKAIYKITNKINGKIYIGESKHPKQRFREHCQTHYKYNSLIHRAIEKYGIENFDFEIIGWFEDWAEKEKYYINFYRSLTPYGYNIHPGGGEPPVLKGKDNPNTVISQEIADQIIADLLEYSLPLKTIVRKHKVTHYIVWHINKGHSWKKDNLKYPLRPSEKELNEKRADMVKDLLKNSKLSQKEIGKRVGWNRSAITMINIGQNHFDENIDYPIRKNDIRRKSLKMFSLEDNKLIKTFRSQKEAALFLGENPDRFRATLAKELKTQPSLAYGYRWEEFD